MTPSNSEMEITVHGEASRKQNQQEANIHHSKKAWNIPSQTPKTTLKISHTIAVEFVSIYLT